MKPGVKRIILGALLFVAAFITPIFFVLPILLGKSDEVKFKAPGKAEFTAKEPGRYYLWNDYRTIYQGRTYDLPKDLPDGMEIHIRGASGDLPLVNDMSISTHSGSSANVSLGYVEVEHPGKLELEITGDADTRIFSFGKSGFAKMMGLIAGGILSSLLMALAGLGLVLWGAIRLVTSGKRDAR